MAPLSRPPSWAMQSPSTTRGEEEVKNCGQAPAKSSFRHSFFPEAASVQESVPRTPRVTTFPSVTVGEERGPACPEAGPVAPWASYLSCQISFPEATSSALKTSFPSCRVNTNRRSPTRAGVESPRPTVTFHFLVSSLGQVFGALNAAAFASRLGPRHCGQSWPGAMPPATVKTEPKASDSFHLACTIVPSCVVVDPSVLEGRPGGGAYGNLPPGRPAGELEVAEGLLQRRKPEAEAGGEEAAGDDPPALDHQLDLRSEDERSGVEQPPRGGQADRPLEDPAQEAHHLYVRHRARRGEVDRAAQVLV